MLVTNYKKLTFKYFDKMRKKINGNVKDDQIFVLAMN